MKLFFFNKSKFVIFGDVRRKGGSAIPPPFIMYRAKQKKFNYPTFFEKCRFFIYNT